MDEIQEFITLTNDIHRFSALQSHMSWDQNTIMPSGGSKARGEIMAWLAGERHSRIIDERYGELIALLSIQDGHDEAMSANLREMSRERDKAVKLPKEFVSRLAKARSSAMLTWKEARANKDFSLFRDALAENIELCREKIEFLGVESTPYDVLLDDFETGMTVADYDPMFDELRARLVPLLGKIVKSGLNEKIEGMLDGHDFPIDNQIEFCNKISEAMGFDFEQGRMDVSAHPFCSGIWPGDTRFTTRFDENDPLSCLYAVMHETGHGLYEQGLDRSHSLTPMGRAISLGVHESQSRFWENQIGLTEAFWNVASPWFDQAFPDVGLSAKELNLSSALVKPDYIRVEADEVTYNLHIMIRYEIEKMIFNEGLEVDQIPEIWNQLVKDYLGIDVPSDDLGCLQDIHWSMIAFGYFPTYTLGNLYAAQLLDAMQKELGDINAIVESGNWSRILDWLKEKIHLRGSALLPIDLITEATGSKPQATFFLDQIEEKYSALYGIDHSSSAA